MVEKTNSDASYQTDEFGRPDYHYRVPKNEASFRMAVWALHGRFGYSDRTVAKWDGFSGNPIDYFGIRTTDSKGHLSGLSEYAHSERWQDGPALTEVDEYRGVSGGTKIRGTFTYNHMEVPRTLQFETAVGLTPTEFEAAAEERDERWQEVREAIRWAKDEAQEEYNERRRKAQESCEHGPVVTEEDDPHIHLHATDAVGYCEDCEAEVSQDGEVVFG